MDQTHISLMETVPSCPQKGQRESGHTHAEITYVAFRSTEAQEVQIKGQFGISIQILCKQAQHTHMHAHTHLSPSLVNSLKHSVAYNAETQNHLSQSIHKTFPSLSA